MHALANAGTNKHCPLLSLPTELHIHIIGFILADDTTNDRKRRNTLKSLSLVCCLFRELAIPHLYYVFDPKEFNGDGATHASEFCEAWMRKEPRATKLASSIQHCIFRYEGRLKQDPTSPSSYKQSCDRYLTAFSVLPNLSQLTLSRTIVEPHLLEKLLLSTHIDALWLEDILCALVQDGVAECEQRTNEELAGVICKHAMSLKTLGVTRSPTGLTIFDHRKPCFALHTLKIEKVQFDGFVAVSLCRFLENMPSLEVLTIKQPYSLVRLNLAPLHSTALPRLHTLTCTLYWALLLTTKPRPIRNLYIFDILNYQNEFDDFMSKVPSFINNIQHIGDGIRCLTLPYPLSAKLPGKYTPNLEYLEVSVPRLYTEVMEWATKVIETLGVGEGSSAGGIWPNLRSCTIRYDRLTPDSAVKYAVDLALQQQHVDSLIGRFPNITEIELCTYVVWHYSSRRWMPKIKGEYQTLYEYFVLESSFIKKDDWWREHDRGGVLEDILGRGGICNTQ